MCVCAKWAGSFAGTLTSVTFHLPSCPPCCLSSESYLRSQMMSPLLTPIASRDMWAVHEASADKTLKVLCCCRKKRRMQGRLWRKFFRNLSIALKHVLVTRLSDCQWSFQASLFLMQASQRERAELTATCTSDTLSAHSGNLAAMKMRLITSTSRADQ